MGIDGQWGVECRGARVEVKSGGQRCAIAAYCSLTASVGKTRETMDRGCICERRLGLGLRVNQ